VAADDAITLDINSGLALLYNLLYLFKPSKAAALCSKSTTLQLGFGGSATLRTNARRDEGSQNWWTALRSLSVLCSLSAVWHASHGA
jgi:hypothetical protein